MAIKLVQLKGFCGVMQDPNYSIKDTAQRIHVEVSALSRQLSSLEDALDIALFDRSEHRKIKPTKEAFLFYEEAIKYTNGIDGLIGNFDKKVKAYKDTHLNIAIHHTAAAYIFPSILKKMLSLNEFKDLTINISVISKEDALKKLISKDIDMAFYVFALTDRLSQGLEKIESISDNILLVFNKSHPLAKKQTVTIEDASKYKFLNRNIKTKTYGNIFKYPSDISIDGNSFEISLEIIKRTDNMTTLPELFFKNANLDDSEVESRNVNHLVGYAYFYIVLRENETPTKPMAWLIDELKSLAL